MAKKKKDNYIIYMPSVSLIKNYKYLLSISYMSGIILGTEEATADQRSFLPSASFILVMETDSNRKSNELFRQQSVLWRWGIIRSCKRSCPVERKDSEKVIFPLRPEQRGASPENASGAGIPVEGPLLALRWKWSQPSGEAESQWTHSTEGLGSHGKVLGYYSEGSLDLGISLFFNLINCIEV